MKTGSVLLDSVRSHWFILYITIDLGVVLAFLSLITHALNASQSLGPKGSVVVKAKCSITLFTASRLAVQYNYGIICHARLIEGPSVNEGRRPEDMGGL